MSHYTLFNDIFIHAYNLWSCLSSVALFDITYSHIGDWISFPPKQPTTSLHLPSLILLMLCCEHEIQEKIEFGKKSTLQNISSFSTFFSNFFRSSSFHVYFLFFAHGTKKLNRFYVILKFIIFHLLLPFDFVYLFVERENEKGNSISWKYFPRQNSLMKFSFRCEKWEDDSKFFIVKSRIRISLAITSECSEPMFEIVLLFCSILAGQRANCFQ